MFMPQRPKRAGLSRVDVTLAVVLVVMVFSLLVVALNGLRRSSDFGDTALQTRNYLKQLALACHSYQDSFKRLPPAFDKQDLAFAASVHVYLLPFIEQDNLFKMMRAAGSTAPGDGVHVWTFLSPMDPSPHDSEGVQNFAANLRVFSDKGLKTPWDWNMPKLAGVEPGSASIPESFTDGTQNTVLFTTKFGMCSDGGSRFTAPPDSHFAAFFGQNAATRTADPAEQGITFQIVPQQKDCRFSPLMPQSFSERFLAVAIADGSVRHLSPNIRPRVWNLILQPNDGQTRGGEWE